MEVGRRADASLTLARELLRRVCKGVVTVHEVWARDTALAPVIVCLHGLFSSKGTASYREPLFGSYAFTAVTFWRHILCHTHHSSPFSANPPSSIASPQYLLSSPTRYLHALASLADLPSFHPVSPAFHRCTQCPNHSLSTLCVFLDHQSPESPCSRSYCSNRADNEVVCKTACDDRRPVYSGNQTTGPQTIEKWRGGAGETKTWRRLQMVR